YCALARERVRSDFAIETARKAAFEFGETCGGIVHAAGGPCAEGLADVDACFDGVGGTVEDGDVVHVAREKAAYGLIREEFDGFVEEGMLVDGHEGGEEFEIFVLEKLNIFAAEHEFDEGDGGVFVLRLIGNDECGAAEAARA